jgi:hypothetical protein
MASLVRASKFRHVYADSPRPDTTFQNFRLSTVTGEQNYIKANPLYFAVGLQVSYCTVTKLSLLLIYFYIGWWWTSCGRSFGQARQNEGRYSCHRWPRCTCN